MKFLVSGASGMVGSNLVPFLSTQGHTVIRLVRHDPQPGDIRWDPAAGNLDLTALEREAPDVIVHLAGDNIASGRWNKAKKARIRDSRVKGTQLLTDLLAKLPKPPQTLICASAIGIYGNRGDDVLNEEEPPGDDFLAGVCQEWEAACLPAWAHGVRVANLRFGIILSPQGGALKKMLLPFKLGAGGVLGGGNQWMSWIALDDVLGAIQHVAVIESLSGPINTVAPTPVTNREFTHTLGKVLSRPTIFPLPAPIARLAFGEMADALLLGSQRVQPRNLLESCYQFQYSELEPALRHLLGK